MSTWEGFVSLSSGATLLMITRQKCKSLQLCLGYRNAHDGMWKNTVSCRAMMPQSGEQELWVLSSGGRNRVEV